MEVRDRQVASVLPLRGPPAGPLSETTPLPEVVVTKNIQHLRVIPRPCDRCVTLLCGFNSAAVSTLVSLTSLESMPVQRQGGGSQLESRLCWWEAD